MAATVLLSRSQDVVQVTGQLDSKRPQHPPRVVAEFSSEEDLCATPTIDVLDVIRKRTEGRDPDFPREALRVALHAVMDADVSAQDRRRARRTARRMDRGTPHGGAGPAIPSVLKEPEQETSIEQLPSPCRPRRSESGDDVSDLHHLTGHARRRSRRIAVMITPSSGNSGRARRCRRIRRPRARTSKPPPQPRKAADLHHA